MVNFGKCCNPIPGDEVFGFVTVNDGIKIHKYNCPNAVSLQANYAYRIMKAIHNYEGDISTGGGVYCFGGV